ncbi:TSUP family transporter [Candidatus Poriferisodalis sp.]|uniref:TSUP family transporter n=1 Tax=Candidatus Poriferisodalis sp. TaxID=3101277 RepID=UPI003B022815
MSVLEYLLAALFVAVGAGTQACIGIGMGLIAGPVLLVIEPTAVPGPMLMIAGGVNLRNAIADRASLNAPALRRQLLAAPLGLVGGLALLAALSDRALTIAVSLFVLLAVAVQAIGTRPLDGRLAEYAAGAGTAFSSSVAAVPGPVYAVFASHWQPAALRATLATYMLVVGTVIISAQAVMGDFGLKQLWLALSLLPAVALGLPFGRWLRPRLAGLRFRMIVLGVAATSATVVLIRQLVSG